MNKKEMEAKRNELASDLESNTAFGFVFGWDSCAKEYEKEIEELNDKLKTLTEVLDVNSDNLVKMAFLADKYISLKK